MQDLSYAIAHKRKSVFSNPNNHWHSSTHPRETATCPLYPSTHPRAAATCPLYPSTHPRAAATCRYTPALTQGRLQHARVLLAVPHGMYLVLTVNEPPKVVLVIRAVESKPESRTQSPDDSGYAGRGHVTRVKSLQFHVHLKLVVGGRPVLRGEEGG